MKSSEHNKIDINYINQMAKNNPQGLIKEAEARYEKELAGVAQEIVKRKGTCSILLTSGPSASTKTTTSNKLAQILTNDGLHAVVVSLDDFFVNRDSLKKLPNGETDFESVNTLDMEVLHRCFDELLNDGESELPIFDFKVGRRSEEKRKLKLFDNTIAIIEGIHALNPILTENRDPKSYLKLYVSPHSDYYDGDEMVLSSRNTRFVRRVVRDFHHRGNSVEKTLQMWANVVKSEVENIIPCRPYADLTVDSTIIYEPCVYARYLSRFAEEGELIPQHKQKIIDLIDALSRFGTIPFELVPKDTVLREFLF